MSNSTRCAACKSLRRRCSQDCVLAPYFPGNNPERFSCVHRIFGASNITKILERLPAHARADAAECMVLEASSRIQDPVYGCTRMISQLQQQIIQTQYEIGKIQGEIAFYSAQQQIQARQFGEPSWVNPAAAAAASDQLQGRSHFDDHQPHLGDFHPQTHF